MRLLMLLLGVLFSTASFSQTEKITDLLYKQFLREQKMYGKDAVDMPVLLQPFQIKNDTLSAAFIIRSESAPEEILYSYRKVSIHDIEAFIKDMNVLFTANEGSVQEVNIIKDRDGAVLETRKNTSHLFFTELGRDAKDESLRRKMLQAFERAGYNIISEYWFN
ncbi:hypothetical protein QRD02_08585 [Aequorivita sp. SDUM287046]|uniref:DUF4252 domain-containing protein n=1 Tax=Aequorivita aurantiaca TaxID=3053356 RepID=A0ABT8DHI6_9FLAO|nr:hypothetical protein [Aequorivita aurantiaca]MDN3724438.1 hypothetical protein [Aequorivita aurantiaca]